jgi:UDP-glucose 4-epimerase
MDVANGHVKALEKIKKSKGLFTYNLGTGIGYSVLDVVNSFMRVNKVDIKYRIIDRRPGDVAENYADTSLAEKEL